jgi:hypothetical protein
MDFEAEVARINRQLDDLNARLQRYESNQHRPPAPPEPADLATIARNANEPIDSSKPVDFSGRTPRIQPAPGPVPAAQFSDRPYPTNPAAIPLARDSAQQFPNFPYQTGNAGAVPNIGAPVVETKVYADGTSATSTGPAPLPDTSPSGSPAL